MPAAFQPSDSLTFKHGRINVMSPPGEGKTFNFLTISAKAPAVWPEPGYKGPPIVLDDIILVLFDSGGLDGLAERGIKVPYVIDMSTMSAFQILQELPGVKQLINKKVAEGGIIAVGWDTMTVFDVVTFARHVEICKDDKSPYKKFDMQLALHGGIFEWLKALQCHVVVNFHEKFIRPSDDKNSRMIADATGIEQGIITFAITGQAASFYRANGSVRLALNKQKRVDGKFDYWLYPQLEGTDAKSRFAFLAAKEPAHLGKLIEKIRANTKL